MAAAQSGVVASTVTVTQRPAGFAAGFTPPKLPTVSRGAFRYHMAYSLLDALSAGIQSNAALMAVKAMQASDAQLQIPIVMTSVGLFASVVMGMVMARRPKKLFVLIPGIASGLSALGMAWTHSAGWFLVMMGMISLFDFSIRPAVPSILRSVYPSHCRSHVAGTLRQYASIVFLGSSLFFAWLLSYTGHLREMIQIQLTLAGFASLSAFLCFQRLPDRGDGVSDDVAESGEGSDRGWHWEYIRGFLRPWKDRSFRRFLIIFFIYCCGNLFYMGIVPAFFARDLALGYVQATLLIHILPSVAGFLAGGRLAAWFDRTSIWFSYATVMMLWGLDPVLLAIAPHVWVAVIGARIARGPAMVGSMVLNVYTGVHRFAPPGPDTSFYMSALFLVNGIARFASPIAAALLVGHMSHRLILLSGGLVILLASGMARYSGLHRPAEEQSA
ncbi:MAG TPA: MFS transporter [Bryobacteraceae bacterium]|nr:MFS transporter [Bryobacteraceae bacterium]